MGIETPHPYGATTGNLGAAALALTCMYGCTAPSVRAPVPNDIQDEEFSSECQRARTLFKIDAERHNKCVEDDDCHTEDLRVFPQGCCFSTSWTWRQRRESRALLNTAYIQCGGVADYYCPRSCTAACIEGRCVGRIKLPDEAPPAP